MKLFVKCPPGRQESNPWGSVLRVICVTIRLSYNRGDLRNHEAIVQPRLYDSLMVTQITLPVPDPADLPRLPPGPPAGTRPHRPTSLASLPAKLGPRFGPGRGRAGPGQNRGRGPGRREGRHSRRDHAAAAPVRRRRRRSQRKRGPAGGRGLSAAAASVASGPPGPGPARAGAR